MPFEIVHNDITNMQVDAIVNPTDSYYSGSGGTDYAIHTAAGPALMCECQHLKSLNQSEIAVTKGYRLPCKYVLHTTGPVWHGGYDNEEALLRACYLNALFKASELGLSSIAFPLISSGTFGFPKDKVLRIAMTAIGDFLAVLDFDLFVYLCVYDPEDYEISRRMELESFLQSALEPVDSDWSDFCAYEICETGYAEPRAAAPECYEESSASMEDFCVDNLDDWLKMQDDTFAVTLLKLIDKKNMTEVQCYKKANVSKKTFWKINNDPNYKPSKQTVIAFAIALELTLTETKDLLRTVGFTLSHSNTFDMIIEFYIQHKVYDIYEINSALYKFDQMCLGC